MTDVAVDGREEPLVSGHSGRMLFLVSFGSMTLFSGQLVLSPLLPTIIATLAITPAQAGVALSVMRALVALCRFPGGRLADQLSRKTVLVAAYGLAIAGFLLLSVADSYPAFLLAVAVLGVGAGLYMPAALTQLTETFVERRGRAFGVHEIAVNLGGVIAGGLAVAAIGLPAWNAVFLPVVVVLAAVAVLTHRWNRDAYVVSADVSFDLRATGSRVFRDPRVLAMLLAFALMAFTWMGTASFLTAFLQAEKGFSPTLAANAFTGLFVVGIAANLVVTPLGDRFGHERTAVASAAFCALGLGLATLSSLTVAVLAGLGLFALGSASFWPLMIASVMNVLPADSMGGDYGVVSMTFMGVGSLGSTYVGVVAERATYATAYLGLVALLVLVVVALLWLARRLD